MKTPKPISRNKLNNRIFDNHPISIVLLSQRIFEFLNSVKSINKYEYINRIENNYKEILEIIIKKWNNKIRLNIEILLLWILLYLFMRK